MPIEDPRTDEELVSLANAGDAAGFDALYVRYRDWVLRVAYRYTHNREDALDVLQETFLYVLRKFPGFRLTGRMRAFLYPVVRSTALTQRRKRRPRLVEDSELVDLSASGGGFEPACDDELRVLLAALTDEQREIVLMRFVDDITPTEIAIALGIPTGTAKSRLHGAIERLRSDPRARRYFEQ